MLENPQSRKRPTRIILPKIFWREEDCTKYLAVLCGRVWDSEGLAGQRRALELEFQTTWRLQRQFSGQL